jgi:hypothetical protein
MEALWGERRYSSYSFSTTLDGGESSASRPGRAFSPGERTPGTHCTGGWVGPRAGLDTEARGKILCPRRGSNPDRPVVQPVVRHYTARAPTVYCTWENSLFGLCPSSDILKTHNVSETGPVSKCKVGDSYQNDVEFYNKNNVFHL